MAAETSPGKRLKVLNCLHRSHPGGAHWRALWVADRIVPHGIDTTLLFPDDEDDAFEALLTTRGTPYVRVRMPGISRRWRESLAFLAHAPWSIVETRSLLARCGIDIVHVNGVTNVVPVLAALSRGIPVAWHLNDMQTPRSFVRLVGPLLRHRNTRVLVATEAIVDHYDLRSLLGDRWTRMPAPLPERAERTRGRLELEPNGIPRDARLIGFVGNLHAVKGVHDFLDAVTPHLTADPRIHAVIVGPVVPTQAEYARRMRDRAEATGQGDRIHFVGFQENVVSWLESFDVFVFPSSSEACPIVVLEAMEAGVPIVATRVGDVPNMLRSIDLPLVEPADVSGLQRGIDVCLHMSQERRRRLAETLQARVRSEYALSVVADRHRDVYRARVRNAAS